MGYEGHVVGLPDRALREQLTKECMERLVFAHEQVGGEIVSAGGTGTFDINSWANEIQAGSYVLMEPRTRISTCRSATRSRSSRPWSPFRRVTPSRMPASSRWAWITATRRSREQTVVRRRRARSVRAVRAGARGRAYPDPSGAHRPDRGVSRAHAPVPGRQRRSCMGGRSARMVTSSVWTNWAGTASCRPAETEFPRSEEEIVSALKRAAQSGSGSRWRGPVIRSPTSLAPAAGCSGSTATTESSRSTPSDGS